MEFATTALLNPSPRRHAPHTPPDNSPLKPSHVSYDSSKSWALKSRTHYVFDAEFWGEVWDAAHEDVSQIAWKRVLAQATYHFLALLIVSGAITCATIVGLMAFNDTVNVCGPNDQFYPVESSYSYWSVADIFQITIHFGSLPFTTVKTLDVFWDVFVGRVGQILIAMISYQVSFRALVRIMENESLPYGTFEATALQSGSWWELVSLGGNFHRLRSGRAKWVVAWITLSTIFVISFPTLLSAMTGYSANVEPFVLINGSYVPYSALSVVRYIIHDGDRINQTQDYVINIQPTGESVSNVDYTLDACEFESQCPYTNRSENNGQPIWNVTSGTCALAWHVSDYINAYSLSSINRSSVFNNSGTMINLTAPTLNISAPSGSTYFDNRGSSCALAPYNVILGDPTTTTWSNPVGLGTNVYDLNYLNTNGICQQTSSYNWGFSFLLLFILLVLLAVWLTGNYVLTIHTYLHSRAPSLRRNDTARYRAILDLASAMRTELGPDAATTLPEQQLRRRIVKSFNGGHIAYPLATEVDIRLSRMQRYRAAWRCFRFRDWFWAEKWWFLLLVLQLVIPTLILQSIFISAFWVMLAPLWVLQTIIALIMGPNSRFRRSRWLALIPFPLILPLLWWLGRKKKTKKVYGEYTLA